MGDSNKSFNFEKLNSKNYSTWSFRMLHFLKKEKLFGHMLSEDPLTEAQQIDDDKVMNFIGLSIDERNINHIVRCTSGRDAWNRLRAYHIQDTIPSQLRIMNLIFNKKLAFGESMLTHLDSLSELMERLATSGFSFPDKVTVGVMLSSLNSDYATLISSLESWEDRNLSIEGIRAKLIEDYDRRNELTAPSVSETALKADHRQCNYCKKKGHLEINCFKKRDERANRGNGRGASPGHSYGNAAFSASRFAALESKIKVAKLAKCQDIGWE